MNTRNVPGYTVVEEWEQLPEGLGHRDVCGMDVDAADRLYVLTRRDPRVFIYNRDGSFVKAWGEGVLTNGAHGICLAPDGAVFCVSSGEHTVRRFGSDGKLLMTIGTDGVAAENGEPFNAPTGLTLRPDGEFYVSDGYGNSRVHHFSADGTLIRSWGEPGVGPGQFNLPHDVYYTADHRLLVADRENDRVQVFDPDGAFVEEWTHLQRPTDICMDSNGLIYVSELKWLEGETSKRRGPIKREEHGRVSILDTDGSLIERIGGSDGTVPGSFWAPHGICVDSAGDLYVGEVSYSFGGFGERGELPDGVRTLQKLARNG